jgi:hypothetical protein
MNVYKWDTPTTKYPDLINIKPVKHDSNIKIYKYIFTILIIIIIIILSYYNGF